MAKEPKLGDLLNGIDKGLNEVEKHFYSFASKPETADSAGDWIQPKLDVSSNNEYYRSLVNINFAAYCKPQDVNAWRCSFCKQSKIVPSAISAYSDRKNLDAAYVATTKDFNLLVFRGTGGTTKGKVAMSWGNNMLAAKHKWPVNVDGSKVHSGFFMSWRNLRHTTLDKVSKLPKGKPLVITGYSRGGAFALFAAFELKKLGYPIREIVTFGAPKVGNRAFVEAFLKIFPQGVTRFVHNRDMVPHVPPKDMKFHHISNEIYEVDGGLKVCRVNSKKTWISDPECSSKVAPLRLSIKNHLTYLGVNVKQEC
jgi:hypothetical protein